MTDINIAELAGRPLEDIALLNPDVQQQVIDTIYPPVREDRTDGGGGTGDEDEDTTPTGPTDFELAQEQQRVDAFQILRQFFQRAGISGLDTRVRELLADNIFDTDAIFFNLRETEQFRTRFAGNAARERAGLPALDPATYIGLEQQYRSILVSNRLPQTFYDQPDDFAKLIENDVSPAEFQSRIDEGFAKVRDADPQVLATLRRFYPEVGNNENALAAYFIDPTRAETAIKRQVQAARIGARAAEQGGLQIGAAAAEALAARGISEQEAQAGFTQMAQLGGLYQEMGGEEMLTEEQKIGAAFGYDVQAQEALRRRQRQRVAEFEAGGQFARTTGATSGTVETGLGQAQ